MIAARSFAQQDVGVFGLARTGLARGARAEGRRRQVYRLGRQGERRAICRGQEGATSLPWREWPWDKIAALVLVARRAADPSRSRMAWCDMRTRAGAESSAMSNCSRARSGADPTQPGTRAGHRHHRHQRQIHHHGADRPHPAAMRLRCRRSAAISASRCWNWRRPAPRRSMCWRCPSSRSISRRASCPMSRVLSNLSPDHIDRHGTHGKLCRREGAAAEADGAGRPGRDRRRRQPCRPRSSPSSPPTAARQRMPVSVGKVLGRGVFVVDGMLYDAHGRSAPTKVMDLADAPRICPARTIGRMRRSPMPRSSPLCTDTRAIAAAIASFPGPGASHGRCRPHRQGALRQRLQGDQCRRRRRARWPVYPDIFWIAGGKPKEGGIESLAPLFPAHPQGLSDRRSGRRIRRARWTARSPYEIAGTLDAAVRARRRRCRAHRRAAAPVVLLSPACASFDQFKDFEAARRCFPRAGRQACRAHPVRRRRHEHRAPTTAASPHWWWTVDRVALVGDAGADRASA